MTHRRRLLISFAALAAFALGGVAQAAILPPDTVAFYMYRPSKDVRCYVPYHTSNDIPVLEGTSCVSP